MVSTWSPICNNLVVKVNLVLNSVVVIVVLAPFIVIIDVGLSTEVKPIRPPKLVEAIAEVAFAGGGVVVEFSRCNGGS
jgi:hypothetical protein